MCRCECRFARRGRQLRPSRAVPFAAISSRARSTTVRSTTVPSRMPAAVTRRCSASIFAEYLDGLRDRAIASRLNADAIPCPSASNPAQNRHRIADGWQGSTVRSILENPRYTGYTVFGRWTKHERLIDPDDVGAGHIMRFVGPTPTRSYVPENPHIPPSSRCTTSSTFSCCVASVAPRAHRSWNADRGRPSSPTSSAAGSDAAFACDVWKDPHARHAPTIAVQREASFRALLP